MPKARNPQIGECPCPARGCELRAQVFRFQGTGDEKRRRFAGKLYGDCSDHGKFGADGKPAMQEYLLENSDLWDESEKEKRNAPAPVKPPAPPQKTPVPEAPRTPVTEPATSPAATTPHRRHVWDM
jgi:hypothetical protein